MIGLLEMHPLLNIDNISYRNFYRKPVLDFSKIDSVAFQLGFTFLGQGRHRRTYLAPHTRFVLKFPLNEYGATANRQEHRLWHKFKNKPDPNNYNIIYAPCRLINSSILLMWAMISIGGDTNGDDSATDSGQVSRLDSDEYPEWSDYVDAEQVGKLRNGKIAAYDFSIT